MSADACPSLMSARRIRPSRSTTSIRLIVSANANRPRQTFANLATTSIRTVATVSLTAVALASSIKLEYVRTQARSSRLAANSKFSICQRWFVSPYPLLAFLERHGIRLNKNVFCLLMFARWAFIGTARSANATHQCAR